ncbi:protein kinase [Rhodococcus opacus]|nr:protein kinase [Rhodococcus opacus]
MVDPAREDTQRPLAGTVTSELSAVGFTEAQEIARGGFGVVYRCRQPTLDRTVAVKVLTTELDEVSVQRFLREQRAMGRLTGHPNIVTVLEAGITDAGRPFIVMPYLPQNSLQSRIRRQGPLSWQQVLRLGVGMASALETAHQLGILHCDVKPGNILITDYGDLQLADFGIAHLKGGFETAADAVAGSPAFTAPEILRNEPPSVAADLYGLGGTLFCALTGHAPFERRDGENVVAQFVRITTDPIPQLDRDTIPDDVCAAIEQAMSADPKDRPESAAVFGTALQQIQQRHGCAMTEMALQTTDLTHDSNSSTHAADRTDRPGGGHPPQSPGPGNLPIELTSFVGRRHEITAARTLLGGGRLLTLTGIGGVGKSRLARRVAAELRRTYDDSVWLVELGQLKESALLAEVVASSLRLRSEPHLSVTDVLVRHLSPRQLLLVLDNCEQIVDEVAALTETLLRTCPQLRVMATSREPLGVPGESVLRVPPLAVPDLRNHEPSTRGMPQYDAVRLFADRASTAVPTFEITDDNRMTVARICQRLDGLPLPIELAAVRLRALSAEQILDRLTDRFQLLTSGGRTATSRQQTLRLSIGWSYDLCDPEEQRLWARLSVFAGSFELDAAEWVCGENGDSGGLLDLLASLVDKSILIREEAGTVVRFRLLDTVREYGREKVTDADYENLRRRHRDFYAELAASAEREWISSKQAGWISRLDREQSNLRDALEYCLTDPADETGLSTVNALSVFWLARGQFGEGERWLARLLASGAAQPTPARARVLYSSSMFAAAQGQISTAMDRLADLESAAPHLGSREIDTLVRHATGYLALYGGRPADAIGDFEVAAESFEADGNLLRQVGSLFGLALACGLTGDEPRAMRCHEEILSITEPRGESVYRSYSRWACGLSVWQQGDSDRATHLLQEGLRLTRLVDDPRGSAWCLQALAWIAAEQRDERRAAVLLGAAGSLWHSMGSPPLHFPNLSRYQQDCERRIRAVLGNKGFDAEVKHGRTLKFTGAVAFALGETVRSDASSEPGTVTLTRREQQVADLVAEGLTNRAIAERLVISPRTAQGHVEHVLVKLGFTSRAQIAAWVTEQERNRTP